MTVQLEQVVKDDVSGEFMDLFVADQAIIYAFVRSLVPNYTDAEEVFQQVAMTLWRKRDTFDPALGTFRAWAMGVARNHVRNFDRQKIREYRLQVFAPDVLDRIAEGWQDFEESWSERQSALKICIGKLPPTDRRRLERYYSKEGKASELAASEGIPLRTFYRKLQKLREILLNCISRTMEAEEGAHGRY